MPEFAFSTDKLLICDPPKHRCTDHIFVSHQSLAEEKSLGKLFLIFEIKSSDAINAEIINQIQEEIKANYFNTDDLNIETAFEKALEKVNQRIADLIGDYDTNWLDRFSGLITILKADQMHFSYIGTIQAFLIRNQRITNIIQSTAEQQHGAEKINPLKAFSHIISGSMQHDDALLMCTPTLLDYLSLEKIKRTIVDHNAHQSISSLERLLLEGQSNNAIAALIIKFDNEPSLITRPEPMQAAAMTPAAIGLSAPQASMDDLLQKQTETGKILSPSLTSYMWQSVKRGFGTVIDFIKLKILRLSPRRVRWQREIRNSTRYTPEDTETKRLAVPIAAMAKKTGQAGKSMFHGIASIFHRAKTDSQTTLADAASRIHRIKSLSATSLIIKFKQLPRLSKFLLLGAMIVAFFLTNSIYSMANSQHSQSVNSTANETIATIHQKVSQAEAALSYDNEDGAKKLLEEAQTLLASLPNSSKDDKATIQQLQGSIDAQREKTKHIVEIASPTTVADLSAQDATLNPNQLLLNNAILYSFDTTKKTIISVATKDGAISLANPETENTFQFAVPQNNTSLLILTVANRLSEYTISSKKLTGVNITFASTDINLAAMSYYESRLYFLDIKNNQILRANKGGSGFSTPVAWIKDSTDVRSAVSIAVDGTIYILQQNGEVVRLSSGQRQSWALAAIEPTLTKAEKIWTNTATNNIYILDATGHRLVEFTKSGTFLNQYTSPAFDALRDVTIDPKAKKAYLLNGQKIYSIDLAS